MIAVAVTALALLSGCGGSATAPTKARTSNEAAPTYASCDSGSAYIRDGALVCNESDPVHGEVICPSGSVRVNDAGKAVGCKGRTQHAP
jgi:hypothetical protein